MMLKWSHATDITNMNQINYYFLQCSVADLAMVPWVPWNPPPPFGLELLLRNTDDEPNGTLLSG